ncbi:MAG: WecB/TagA/CpsF family glycosyltransferase [Peptococcaceae bacterium]|nr:WecB/TagA/CpsF family glycosyltransferase [Peptococcaceae bacterium]
MRISLLGASIDALGMEETVERVAVFIKDGRPRRVITLNPEFLYRAQSAGELLDLVKRADVVTPDGEGIVWACRMAGRPVPERVTGIDLMLRLVEKAAAEGWRVYLLGAAPGVAEEAAERLGRLYPGLRVAGCRHGYFQEDEGHKVAEEISKAKPDLLFAALGAPKQEKWIDSHLEKSGATVAIGVGGSLDVLAGRVRRAPGWVRRLRLEWLYRLLSNPSRWRRQLVLPLFAWLVVKEYKLKRVRF